MKDLVVVGENTPSIQKITGLPDDLVRSLDYTTLPTITFDGEQFRVRDRDWIIRPKEGFEAVILTATSYWYVKALPKNGVEHAIPGFYTYDKEMTTRGEPVSDVIGAWEADGFSHTEKEYLELKVMMAAPEDAKNELAIVQISPTSVKRMKAYLAITLGQKRLSPRNVVTRFKAGNQVKGANGKLYHVWAFELAREL